MTPEPLTCQWIDGPAELADRAPDYAAWIKQAGPEGFFYQPWWLALLLGDPAGLPAGVKPVILLLRHGNTLVGAGHFQIQQKGWLQARRRVLQWLATQRFEPPCMLMPGLIFARDADPSLRISVMETTLRAWQERGREWDSLEWGLMPCERPELAAPALADSFQRLDEPVDSPWIELGEDYEAYEASLGPRLRRNIRADRRRLERAGHRLTLEWIDKLDPGHMDRFEAWHTERQQRLQTQGRGRVALFVDPDRDHLLRRLLLEAESRGQTLHACLAVDDQPVAYLLNFQWGQDLIAYLTTFDEAWSYYQPGLLVFVETFRRAMAERDIRRVHLMPGGNPTKDGLANTRSALCRFEGPQPGSFRARWRHGAAMRMRSLKDSFSSR